MTPSELPPTPVDLSRFNNPFVAFWHAVTHISFSGRACRKEYWMAVLGNLIIAFALGLVFALINVALTGDAEQDSLLSQAVDMVYTLLTFVVFLALGVRRLHDTGRSGWWYLINLIPLIGSIVMLVFCCLDSEPGDNKYGVNPKGC